MSDPAAVGDGAVLDQEALRNIARNVKKYVPTSSEPEAIKSMKRSHADGNRSLEALFEKIFNALNDPHQSASTRVAAVNALCALIDHTSTSSVVPVKTFFWNHQIWTRAFQIYVDQASFTKPRASRQLLTSLTNALHRNSDEPHVYNGVLDTVVHDQIALLCSTDSSDQVKTAVTVLSYFLSKDVLGLPELLRSAKLGRRSSELSTLQQFLLLLFEWINRADLGSSIGHLIANILQKVALDESGPLKPSQAPVWIPPLKHAALTGKVDIDHLRVHLLPLLVQRNVGNYTALLSHLINEQTGQLDAIAVDQCVPERQNRKLFYASLRSGKESSLLVETEAEFMTVAEGVVLVPFELIASLFRSRSRSARLTALSLLVDSPAVTKSYHPLALDLIQQNFNQLLNDQDASFRGEVSSLLQRLINRIRTATAVLSKQDRRDAQNCALNGVTEAAKALGEHKKFIQWLISAVLWELRPTASYQRHISALKSLSIIIRSGLDPHVAEIHISKQTSDQATWAFHIQVISHELRCLLLDLLVDPFDDVRQTAANILAMCFVEHNSFESRIIQSALDCAEQKMLRSGRADQADGVAHLYALLNQSQVMGDLPRSASDGSGIVAVRLTQQLESMLKIAQENLMAAVEKYPVHGLLTSLRLVLEQDPSVITQDSEMNDRVCKSLHLLWDIVKPILCDDAPEGYLPESFESSVSVTTRDTLSYCWRALKEASLLIASLVSWTNKGNVDKSVQNERISEMSELCFQQLAELRHRGAFSTVAQTWVACCTQARNLVIDEVHLLQSWYNRVLTMLRTRTTINTRRSAGIPSLVCGILISTQSEVFFRQAFEDLEVIAQEPVSSDFLKEGSLPQVHAMNCLKDVLKNARLGELSERYIPLALRLAVDALRSEAWAVRNCGLMLFRSVIDRLLGTSEAHLDDEIRVERTISEEQCPGLLSVVLDLLSDAQVDARHNEGVFPGLQLLQKLRIPGESVERVQQVLLALMSGRIWHVRDKAARVYASFVDSEGCVEAVRQLLDTDATQQNAVHGILLCVRYIIAGTAGSEHKAELDERCCNLVNTLLDAAHVYHENGCEITCGSFIDALREGLLPMSARARSEIFAEIGNNNIIQLLIELNCTLVLGHGNPTLPVLRLALARALGLCMQDSIGADGVSAVRKCTVDLAVVDGDACIEFLRMVDVPGTELDATSVAAILDIGTTLLGTAAISTAVKGEAQRLLLNILRRRDLDHGPIAPTPHQLWATQEQLPADAGQTHFDLALQLRTICLERAVRQQAQLSPQVLADFQMWVDDCTVGMTEEGIFTREAVAAAVEDLHEIWALVATSPDAQDAFCVLCSLVYDLLNDDEEDIRLGASRPASRILQTQHAESRQEELLAPLVAGQRLAQYMSRRFKSTPSFGPMVISRAFGISLQTEQSVDSRLAHHLDRDVALFAEEKSNLYIDDAREARLWSLVAREAFPTGLDEITMQRLGKWADDGLAALNRFVEADHAGPVGGLASDAEVFTLGLQVIYAAEWCLTAAVPSAINLRERLLTLESASQVHPLWAAELRAILERDGIRGLDHKAAVLMSFADSARVGTEI